MAVAHPAQRRAGLPGLAAARLAPSAHNTQPWRFQPDGRGVLLGWDAARELPAGDPHGDYLLAGLGAAAESLALGAAAAGLVAQVRFAPCPARRVAGRVDLTPGAAPPADLALAAAIPQRHTARLPFHDRAVPAAVLGRVGAAAERHGCHLVVVTGRRRVERIAALIEEGTARNLADPAVFAEFAGWLRPRPGDPRRDGLPLDTLGLGWAGAAAARWALRPGPMRLLAAAGLHRTAARTQARLARRSPAFCLLVARSDEPAARFDGGRALLRGWLAATAAGLRVHPMTAAMDHADTRAALAEAFGVPAGAPLLVVCARLGEGPAAPARSPRLPAAALLPGG